jgi:hypothetical protein
MILDVYDVANMEQTIKEYQSAQFTREAPEHIGVLTSYANWSNITGASFLNTP